MKETKGMSCYLRKNMPHSMTLQDLQLLLRAFSQMNTPMDAKLEIEEDEDSTFTLAVSWTVPDIPRPRSSTVTNVR